MATLQGNQVASIMESVLDKQPIDEYEDDDESDGDEQDGDGPANLQLGSVKQEPDGESWGR
jgi:hypothetical protein